MTTLRESLATLRSDMRTQLSELRGELEREKNERMILEKEVMKECFDGNIIMNQQSFPDILLMQMYFPGRSLEEETKRLILIVHQRLYS